MKGVWCLIKATCVTGAKAEHILAGCAVVQGMDQGVLDRSLGSTAQVPWEGAGVAAGTTCPPQLYTAII